MKRLIAALVTAFALTAVVAAPATATVQQSRSDQWCC